MRHEDPPPEKRPAEDDVYQAAQVALQQLFMPIAEFSLSAALSHRQVEAILRVAMVQAAVQRQAASGEKPNVSGIAAVTGLNRAAVSRIVKQRRSSGRRHVQAQAPGANRVLTAWHSSPRYTNPNGEPAELPIFGRGATFESLAKRYGRGLPARALLDALSRAGAVELTAESTVRARSSMTQDRGANAAAMRAFGDRGAELLATLIKNLDTSTPAHFIASMGGDEIGAENLPLFKRGLETKGAVFLSDLQDDLDRGARQTRSMRGRFRVGVTLFYHEVTLGESGKTPVRNRKNFKRRV